MRVVITACLYAIVAAATTGCQQEYRSDARKLAGIWSNGNYPAAATLAYKDAREEARHRKNRVVYFLEGGRTAQAAGDYETSIECYDAAFVDMYPYMKEAPEATVSEAIVTTAMNDTMSRYRGTPNDRIMLHAANALNFMAMGEMEDARVELNRGILWTEDAEHRYGKAIALAHEKNNAKVAAATGKWDSKGGSTWSGNSSGVMHSNTDRIMSDHYGSIPDHAEHARYVNPWALHLDAVFRLTRGDGTYDNDHSMAHASLAEVMGMTPQLRPHLAAEMGWASAGQTPPPTTWVYFMSGMGPYLEQETIAMPIPLSSGFTMPTLALPKLEFSDGTLEALHIGTSDRAGLQTHLLADTAAISAAQFKERLPIIISQEAMRATGKAIATYFAMQAAQQAQNSWASLLAIGALVYQIGSAQADLRCWRTMPAEIQVARLATPADGQLQFRSPEGTALGSVDLRPDESHIVVVSVPSRTATMASIMPIQLTGPRDPYVPTFSLKPPPEAEETDPLDPAIAEDAPAESAESTSANAS
ncbi:MAG: hypothetical protein QF733_06050 [Phycisphaerales bacterium]|jgi:hypothetical protein|nr:hypothetical protein [Phycisphaerales bacterium]